jgi:hypothetical protein
LKHNGNVSPEKKTVGTMLTRKTPKPLEENSPNATFPNISYINWQEMKPELPQ